MNVLGKMVLLAWQKKTFYAWWSFYYSIHQVNLNTNNLKEKEIGILLVVPFYKPSAMSSCHVNGILLADLKLNFGSHILDTWQDLI